MMKSGPRIEHVNVTVSDPERAARLMAALFGWHVLWRAHLLRPDIGLDTHVADIVGLLHHQDLKGVTLVGHSYGGTVITAAAERVPDRIGRLVYLDAAVPRDGESNNDVVGPELAASRRPRNRMARVACAAGGSIGSGLPTLVLDRGV